VHPTADARRIHEPPRPPAEVHEFVHGVPGGAGDGVHHHTLRPHQRVEQGGLADVRPPDQRHPPRPRRQRRTDRGYLREHLEDGVEQVARTAPVQRRHRVRLPQAQRPQLGGVGLQSLVVHLVRGQDHGLAGAAQHAHHLLVRGGRPDGGVHHEDDGVRQFDRDLRLLGDAGLDALRVLLPATGVHHEEPPPRPFGRVGHAVPGDAGDVLHHRLAAAEDPVDQRGLPHVRPTDDRDHRQRAGGFGLSPRRPGAGEQV